MSTPSPIPSPEQTGAELLTLLAIKQAGSTPAQKLAAAEVALSVASAFTNFANGDIAALNAELNALVSKVTDPGVKAVVTSLMAQAQPYIDAEVAIAKGIPVAGMALDAFLQQAAAGITVIASAYTTPPAAAK